MSIRKDTSLKPTKVCDDAHERNYRNGGASVEMQLGDNWRVSLDDALMTLRIRVLFQYASRFRHRI